MNSLSRGTVAIAALVFSSAALAQGQDWERTMVIYLLGAGMDGQVQIGPVTTDIDQSFSDILENLDFGVMGSFHARREQLAHTLDVVYVGLGVTTTGPAGARFEAEVDQLIASYDIAYFLGERLEVLAGARYNSLDTTLDVRGPFGVRSADKDIDWIDPYVGVRSTLPLGDSFSLTLRGDVGGFDVGSKLAWQAVVRLDWWFHENFAGMLGYRVLDTDYEDGSGASLFRYDVMISGPMLGFGWKFR
jgi:hypothetical protein